MAFEEELDPDWFHEAPYFLVAVIGYGILFTLNPAIRWGTRERAPDPSVPIEFVAAPPPPAPPPPPPTAAVAAGLGSAEPAPHKGPGEYEAEKVKKGAIDAPPKPKPNPKPAAIKSNREKAGATVAKAKPAPKAAPKPKPAVDAKAIVAQSIARRQKLEQQRAAKAAADLAARRRAEEAAAAAKAKADAAAAAKAQRDAELRAAAAARAEAARERAAALAEEKARKRAAAQAAAEARAAAERARLQAIAERKAAAARKKAELSQELATMSDPDNALAQDEAGPAPASGGVRTRVAGSDLRRKAKNGAAEALSSGAGGDADGSDGVSSSGGAALAGARRAGAAAALADAAESTDPGDAAGSGGADLIDSPAKGGGTGPDGNGVSYSIDGPLGNRRVVKRFLPTSPDWVGTRGLDLSVTVRFQVLPGGSVKPGSVVQKTSGFPEIDRKALDAIREWRFTAVRDPNAPEVWGRVTFRFTSS